MSWLMRQPPPMQWLQLHFGHELDEDSVRQFVMAVLGNTQLGVVVFEVEDINRTAVFRVGTSDPASLREMLDAHLPGAGATTVERSLSTELQGFVVRSNTTRRALKTDLAESASASLLGAVGAGLGLRLHQVVVGQRLRPQVVGSTVERIPGTSMSAQLFHALFTGVQRMDGESRGALRDKRTLPGASVTVRLVGPAKRNPGYLSGGYMGALRSLSAPGLRLSLTRERAGRAMAGRPGRSMALNADEIVSLLAWPYGARSYRGVDRSRSITLPAELMDRSARVIGESTHPGAVKRLGLNTSDGVRHMHVLGPTGVGKSTLLASMILQDVGDNRSVVVIDPKGDLIDDLLARIPDGHVERVVLVDLSSSDHVVGLNPLAVDAGQRHLAVDGVLHVFKNLYASAWGPRSQDLLHASLLTLVQSEQPNIIAVERLLTDQRFRTQITRSVNLGPELVSFWGWFDQLPQGERASVVAPLLNKLRPLTLRPSLRAMLSAPEPFDLKRVLSERKILLVALRRGQVGAEVADLLGSLLMAQLWQTVQSRSGIASKRRHPTFIYADEFQTYTRLPTDFADVLAQARGLGVGMILAHQNLGQLEPSLRASVTANAQNKVYFRLGTDDAATVTRHTDELTANDFVRLPAYEAYAQLLEDGHIRPWASLRTMASKTPLRDPNRLAKMLLKRWGQPRQDTVDNVSRDAQAGQHSGAPTPVSIGRRKRKRS
ncbi:type IV secretory system conjugative DNA transfer family protein [Acidimicrobiales bacterium]|nr:type IV secretory system conjugative DNA transfer family protein [Acidimicrobiales bacterium]